MFECFKKFVRAKRSTVRFDDDRITHTHYGRIEYVAWAELRAVDIVTTDRGPFVDDVFWVLQGEGQECVVPSEADGAQELLERLQSLPDFDSAAVIEAMGSTDNARFAVWRRSPVAHESNAWTEFGDVGS